MSESFDFSVALNLLRHGRFVGRKAWKDGFVFMVSPMTVPTGKIADPVLGKFVEALGHTEIRDVGNIRMFFEGSGSVINGWTPGIVDLVADDWCVYDTSAKMAEHIRRIIGPLLTGQHDAEVIQQMVAKVLKDFLHIEVLEVIEASSAADGALILGGKYEGFHIQTGDGYYSVGCRGAGGIEHMRPGRGDLLQELAKVAEDAGVVVESRRKFYHTLAKIELLHEEPYPEGITPEELVRSMREGDDVGRFEILGTQEIKGQAMAELLSEFGSEPGFFQLDEHGRDTSQS
jgi:hypothetical protein